MGHFSVLLKGLDLHTVPYMQFLLFSYPQMTHVRDKFISHAYVISAAKKSEPKEKKKVIVVETPRNRS